MDRLITITVPIRFQDGSQSNSGKKIASRNVSVSSADIDGDGDLEILAAGEDLWIYDQDLNGDWCRA